MIASLITASPAVPPPGHRPTTMIPNGSRGVARPPGAPSSGRSQDRRHQHPSLSGRSTAPRTGQPARHPAGRPPSGHGDGHTLVDAASRIVAAARRDGEQLSRAGLAARLRGKGYTIANRP